MSEAGEEEASTGMGGGAINTTAGLDVHRLALLLHMSRADCNRCAGNVGNAGNAGNSLGESAALGVSSCGLEALNALCVNLGAKLQCVLRVVECTVGGSVSSDQQSEGGGGGSGGGGSGGSLMTMKGVGVSTTSEADEGREAVVEAAVEAAAAATSTDASYVVCIASPPNPRLLLQMMKAEVQALKGGVGVGVGGGVGGGDSQLADEDEGEDEVEDEGEDEDGVPLPATPEVVMEAAFQRDSTRWFKRSRQTQLMMLLLCVTLYVQLVEVHCSLLIAHSTVRAACGGTLQSINSTFYCTCSLWRYAAVY
jgi:hypothetical protein